MTTSFEGIKEHLFQFLLHNPRINNPKKIHSLSTKRGFGNLVPELKLRHQRFYNRVTVGTTLKVNRRCFYYFRSCYILWKIFPLNVWRQYFNTRETKRVHFYTRQYLYPLLLLTHRCTPTNYRTDPFYVPPLGDDHEIKFLYTYKLEILVNLSLHRRLVWPNPKLRTSI